MNMQFNSLLSVILIPQVLGMIEEKDGLDDEEALNGFYNSKTYEVLSNEETKVWHYSALTIYMMWKEEKETGKLVFPEEQ